MRYSEELEKELDINIECAKMSAAGEKMAGNVVKEAYDKGMASAFIQTRAWLAAQPKDAPQPTCEWNHDEDGHWLTSCGTAHDFATGGVIENHFIGCPYCARGIKLGVQP